MARPDFPSAPKVYASLVLFFLILLLILPKSGKFNYDYKKGSPWNYETLVAQFDFPILKTDEMIQSEKEEAGTNVIPYYRYSEKIANDARLSADALEISDEAFRQGVTSEIASIFSRGIIADDHAETDKTSAGMIFIQKDKRAIKRPVSDVRTVSAAKEQMRSELAEDFPRLNVDSLLYACGAFDIIVPNLVYDKETSSLVHAESVDNISPTQGFVTSGQVIVQKGEIVTAEIQQMLDSYKAEYENNLGYNGPRALLWLGNSLIAFALIIILFLSIFYTYPKVFGFINEYVYILFIVTFAAILALLMDKLNPRMLYIVPFSLMALYLLAFFKKRVVLPVYVISLLPLLVFCHNGIELFVMNLVSGVVTMYVFQFFNRGWKQFVTALVAFFAMLGVYVGFKLLDDTSVIEPGKIALLALGSVLSVAGYPLIYLFEKVFNLVSNSRLAELCDTNNKLLQELAQKAPGTFQHSLQVMNMSEAAARSIGANVLLVKAGALYHDIGKMENPQCFVENSGVDSDYHSGLTPQESAHEIIKHVSDGLVIAEKYNLPQVVRSFIMTHHGTTQTAYFFNRYVNAGGDPANAADFTYPGPAPASKEQIIVMLCDTLEAASRTLKDNSPETFDKFVENIVAGKMQAGQFDNADISLKDLGAVKNVMKAYLTQMYHERIAYPKRNR